MKEVIVSVLAVVFTAVDYIIIKRKELLLDDIKINFKGIFPSNAKEWLLAVIIPVSFAVCGFMLIRYYKQDLVLTAKRLCIIAVLWPAAVIDYKEYRIPNKLILIGLAARVGILAVEFAVNREELITTLISEGIALPIISIICLACALVSKGSIGMGDIKLLMVMSLFLGIEGICYSMFYSAIAAFITAVSLLITKKKGRKDKMPFAPSILVGTLLCVILSGV